MVRATRVAIALCLALTGAGAAGARADPAGDALARLQQAIAAAEKHDGAASPRLLPLLAGLARLRFAAGDLPAATAAARRGLTITIAAFKAGSPRAAAAMTALAETELDRLHYLDAEPLLIVAGNIAAAQPRADARTLVAVLAGLARVALARGDLSLAQTRAERAAALMAQDPSAGSTAPLRALGAVLAAERKFADGERVLQKAVALDRARCGDDSPETARSLSQLGNLYLRADRFRDALPPLERAAAIDQSRLAPDHPFIADDFHDIGIADEGLQRPAAARRVLAAAIRLLRRASATDGARFAWVELELAHVDRDEGDTAAADTAFRHARHILNAAADAERRREARI